ncbi:MAG: polysaccharide biosynthesis C-terminal domain-containing protein, partial [Oscillospiraceae bacterium]|nr:polysaccharide biosynthesis C-terminal domain-containing protein [Oscillospiraceae bacterium]
MDKTQAQYQKMTETPIRKLILSLSAPTIVSMLVTAIYNMADTFFVSKLGTSASGAVGVVFSIMAVIQAIGFTLGMGSGSIISRLLGRRQVEDATRYASTGFFTCFGLGCVLTVAGTLLLDPLMTVLGATPTILPYARAYGQYILLAAPFMASSFVLNNILRFEGKASLAMIGLTTGGILNMVLDPIFIFALGLGTAGAAIATGISQLVSF